ncbi:unnamed protein product [Adineta ricciae]|uniref:3',5'-cyclic-nucleotide phosphodiesterase n=1 Tax=Adineta ricciae TaxID=249248 RepID=A0A815A0M8_ADIRI|nr:unnamed protein product [Adineta ricciae]CAF1248508.1 unnamed protein product [Adineta ricciae]
MLILSAVTVVLLVINVKSTPEKSKSSSFYIVPLGTSGGLDESNLSSYLLTTVNESTPNSAYISLDSGTLRHGLEMAIKQNCFSSQSLTAEQFLQEKVKAYFISHGHLDHINGFILNSPNDKSGKTIFALNETIQIIQDDFFNNQAWADFGPHGLKLYNYQILDPLSTNSIPIPNTDLNVRIFRLCHTCPFLSSAFLISRRDESSASILYLGDTGPDDIEKIVQIDNSTYYPRYLEQLWQTMGPLVVANQLKAIFIEVSYSNERPDHLLFGHLTPKWLLKELDVLRSYHSMENVTIAVTHIKPEEGSREKIMKQLKEESNSNYNFVFPRQGEPIWV